MPELTASLRPLASAAYPWYDSLWLSAYHRARSVLRVVAPHKLPSFESAMSIFRTAPGYSVAHFKDLFEASMLEEIRQLARSLSPAQLEMHEAREFKRFVVHDHPRFSALHASLADRVSEAAGEPVEASYNFLSLYGAGGVCPLHLDAPLAKYTLDLCLGQHAPWPIQVSPVVPWPEPVGFGAGWERRVRAEVPFDSFSLEPGEAILFSGSSQWHYRDEIPAAPGRRYCDLLFLHFRPARTAELVDPSNWARLFDVPELARDEIVVGT